MSDVATYDKRDYHVIPVFEGELIHAESHLCWCEPELIYVGEESRIKVWTHRRPE